MNPRFRYKGFISYSHRDKKMVRRLHRALESFKTSVDGRKSVRLGRLFRDDDELTPSGDLGDSVKQSIEGSEFLIVMCSTDSANSEWVQAEIKHFHETHGSARILAVILSGQPNSPDETAECLPPQFRRRGDGASMPLEPLAVDLRSEGLNRAIVKIAAALLGVPFDQLWDRARRRQRRQRALLGVAAAGACVLGGVTIYSALENAAQKRFNAQQELRRTSEALREVEVQARFLAQRALLEDDQEDATLLALEAWSMPDPRQNAEIATILPLSMEEKLIHLRREWRDNGLSEPSRGSAASILRRGLSNPYNVWSRQFGNGFHNLAVSQDGSILVHAQEDGAITIDWPAEPERRFSISGFGAGVSFEFSEDGHTLFIGANLALLKVDLENRSFEQQASFHRDDPLRAVKFNLQSDLALLLTGTGEVRIVSLVSGETVRLQTEVTIGDLAWNNDLAMVGNRDGLKTFAPQSGDQVASMNIGQVRLIYRPDYPGRNVLGLIGNDDQVLLNDSDNNQRILVNIEGASGYFGREMLLDPKEDRLFVNTGANFIYTQRLGDPNEDHEKLFCGSRIKDIDVDFEKRRIAAATEYGTICVWSLDKLQELSELETEIKIENMALRGDVVTYSDLSGWVRAKVWSQSLEYEPLVGCKENIDNLFFSVTGETLIATGGFVGLCSWDIRTEAPAARQTPSLQVGFAEGAPMRDEPIMLSIDRYGIIHELNLPDMTPVRHLHVGDEVFHAASYVNRDGAVLGRTIEGKLYFWSAGSDGDPVKLSRSFELAKTYLVNQDGAYLSLVDEDGDAHLFNIESGSHLTTFDLENPIQLALLDPHDEGLSIMQINPRRAFYVPIESIASLPRLVRNVADDNLVEPLPLPELQILQEVATASNGVGLVAEVRSSPRLLRRINAQSVGMGQIRDITLQPPHLGGDRKVAILAAPEITDDHPSVLIATLPAALARYYHPDSTAELDQAEGEDYGLLRAFWEREAEHRQFRLAARSVARCLAPQQRASLELQRDPPCWCASKPIPTAAEWYTTLGRDPFTDLREDGTLCSQDQREPWNAAHAKDD